MHLVIDSCQRWYVGIKHAYFCHPVFQLIYVGCVARRELKTNRCTIHVSVLEVLSLSTRNGKSFNHSVINSLTQIQLIYAYFGVLLYE